MSLEVTREELTVHREKAVLVAVELPSRQLLPGLSTVLGLEHARAGRPGVRSVTTAFKRLLIIGGSAVLLVASPDHDPVPAFRALAGSVRLPGDS